MEKFTEFTTYVLYLLTKAFLNGNYESYDSLKDIKKEIIALAKNMNYKESRKEVFNKVFTTLEFYDDEDNYLGYSITFYEVTDKCGIEYMRIIVGNTKKKFEVGSFK